MPQHYRQMAEETRCNSDRLYLLLVQLQRHQHEGVACLHMSASDQARVELVSAGRHAWCEDVSIRVHHAQPAVPDAEVRVRCYHDVRTADILEWDRHQRAPARCQPADIQGRLPDERLQRLRMLLTWLEACCREARVAGNMTARWSLA
jgi:uncharacterized protein YqiB (DUF1249 family)